MTNKCPHRLPYYLVLDLDSTLVHTTDGLFPNSELSKSEIKTETLERIRTIKIGDEHLWFIMRPYTIEFLRWAKTIFLGVIIWSAGSPDYVEQVAGELGKYCYFAKVLTRDQCVRHKGAYTKPLANLNELVPHLQVDGSNVFIVDDKDYTFDPNPGQGILIPAYEPTLEEIVNERAGNRDVALLTIIHFFCHEDAYDYIKRRLPARELFKLIEVDFDYNPEEMYSD